MQGRDNESAWQGDTAPIPPPCWLTDDDAITAWIQLPRFRQVQIARAAEASYQSARAYAWARQETGEGARDPVVVAIQFAEYRRNQVVLFGLRMTWFLANLQIAFDEWRRQPG